MSSGKGGNVRIVSIGEILWDVINGAEFLGGAPLNFSAHSQRLGNSVALISAVGADARGERTLSAVQSLGLTIEFIQTTTKKPTATACVSFDALGNAVFSFDRPAAYDFVSVDEVTLSSVAAIMPNWIYFGTLAETVTESEETLRKIIESCPAARRFYDMNLRAGYWTLPLVERLCRIATVLKLNEAEAELLFQSIPLSGTFSVESFCRQWAERHGLEAICTTLGSRGCAVFTDGQFTTFPGHPVTVADTVGAGDAFAAGFLHGLDLEWPLERTASFANALGALVASRSGATPEWNRNELEAMLVSEDRRAVL